MSRGASRIPRSLAVAFAMMGLVATSTQVLLIRRLMSALYGNELIVGLVLALWMVGTAIGSLAAARATAANPRPCLAIISTVALALTPVTLLGSYGIKAAYGIHAAQALAPGQSLLACTLLMLPLTALMGAAFVFFSTVDRKAQEERIGAVYLYEALGAAAGGLACGLAASLGLAPFGWGFGIAAGFCAMAWLTAPPGARWRLAAVGLLAAVAFLTWGPGEMLPTAARGLAWPDYKLLETVESRHASIAVAESEGQRTVFVDGLPDFTAPDVRGAEEVIHTALLQHPRPRRVLLIGGGLTGAAREAFKHGVEDIDYVQIDPVITRLEREHLSGELEDIFSDSRVTVHNVDGRFFLANAKGPPYDAIVVNAPDPATALINRFYTVEFFDMAKGLLVPEGGVFSFGCGQVANYVSRSQGRLLACQARTLAESFDYQVILPLARVHFIASNQPGWLAGDGPELASRLEARGVDTAFMRDYYLGYDLSDERVEYLADVIERAQETERPHLNRDRNPVGYFYYLVHWYRLLGSTLADVMELPWGRHGPWMALLAGVVGFAGTSVPGVRSRTGTLSLAVLGMGFVTLTSQVVLLLAFQTFRGYLFHSVGMIVAAFMVGLSVGALCVRRISTSLRIWPIQAMLAAYCGVLGAMMSLPLERMPALGFTALAVFVSLAGGVLGGAVFQSAARLSGSHVGGEADDGTVAASDDSSVGSAAGLLNACDHLGAALGAIAAASLLLPVLGLAGTALMAAAAAAGSALGLGLSRV